MSIQCLRKRLPFAVFVLLLILFVVVLAFVCMCLSDHPSQAADRALGAAAHAPAVLVVWTFALLLSAPLFAAVPIEPVPSIGRASPARLQRFLF